MLRHPQGLPTRSSSNNNRIGRPTLLMRSDWVSFLHSLSLDLSRPFDVRRRRPLRRDRHRRRCVSGGSRAGLGTRTTQVIISSATCSPRKTYNCYPARQELRECYRRRSRMLWTLWEARQVARVLAVEAPASRLPSLRLSSAIRLRRPHHPCSHPRQSIRYRREPAPAPSVVSPSKLSHCRRIPHHSSTSMTRPSRWAPTLSQLTLTLTSPSSTLKGSTRSRKSTYSQGVGRASTACSSCTLCLDISVLNTRRMAILAVSR